ncbi:hypothetical protein BHM03_00062452, partial [Ensete ventricosum]
FSQKDALALSLPPSASPPPLPLRRWRCCTPSAWATAPSAGATALRRHLVGERRRLARALPLLATAPANGRPCRRQPWHPWQRAVATCGLTAGAADARKRCPYRRQLCPWATALAGGCPCKGVLFVVDCPLTGILGHSRLPLATGPAWGLAMAGRPSSSLFLL